MGLFGRGIAFNQTFIRRTPMRLPMISRGAMPGITSVFSYSESYSCKTNFWDFANTLLQTYAMTSMMFGGWGAARTSSVVTPQGSTNTDAADNLKDLKELFAAKKVNITESNGKYTATDENGDLIGQDLTFDEMTKVLGDYKRTKVTQEPAKDPVQDQGPKEDPVQEQDPKNDPAEEHVSEPGASRTRSGGTRRARSGSGSSGATQNPAKTIKGNNGYYVEIYKDGTKKYFDNHGKPVGETEFAHNCPNIHASVTKNDPANKAEEAKYKNSNQKVSIKMNVTWIAGVIKYTASGSIRDFKGNMKPISISNEYFAGTNGFDEKSAMSSAIKDAEPKLRNAGKNIGYPNLTFLFPKN